MKAPLELDGVTQSSGLKGNWSFMPYEDEPEYPRREILVLRVVRGLLIPLADICSLAISITFAYILAEIFINSGDAEVFLGNSLGTITIRMFWVGLATIPMWLIVFSYFGVYRRELRRLAVSTFDELPQTLGAISVGAWGMFSLLAVISRGNPTGRAVWLFVAVAWLTIMLLLPMGRIIVRVGLSFYNPFRTSTLVVGAGEVGNSLIGKLNRHKEYGLRVVGFLDTDAVDDESGGNARVKMLGRPSELRSIIDQYGISRVLIAFSRTPHPQILDVINKCQELKVDVSVVPRFFEALSNRVEIEDLEGLPLLSLPRYSRHGFFMRRAKRLIDLFGAIMAVFIFSPVLLIAAIFIKLDSPGPIFFTQERMGKNHKRFLMYKFRSMNTGAEVEKLTMVDLNEASGPIFKMKEDPRITRVGRTVRRLSIDELPQLINVFRGEMSLVGPRPLPVEEAEACHGTADMRHQVQPGVTGLWQILGRSDIPYEEMVQLDYLYVANWSLRWDIKIILRTFIAILRKRGAY
ncbi:MAG: sugar transferase [Thermoleophilia bacterium]